MLCTLLRCDRCEAGVIREGKAPVEGEDAMAGSPRLAKYRFAGEDGAGEQPGMERGAPFSHVRLSW